MGSWGSQKRDSGGGEAGGDCSIQLVDLFRGKRRAKHKTFFQNSIKREELL